MILRDLHDLRWEFKFVCIVLIYKNVNRFGVHNSKLFISFIQKLEMKNKMVWNRVDKEMLINLNI